VSYAVAGIHRREARERIAIGDEATSRSFAWRAFFQLDGEVAREHAV